MMLLVFMLLIGMAGQSPQAAQPWKVMTLDLAGADGANNNTAFVEDRYIMVAPYAPSKMPTDAAAVEPLDNCNIFLVDSKKPSDNVQAHVIGSAVDPKMRLYYPTRLMYDERTHIAYVRGTRYEPVEGGVKEIAVIAYMHVNLDTYGKPTFDDNVVMIDIAGVGEETVADAPDDFLLAYNGELLVFTNGASVFTFNINHGYLYQVDLVKAEAYDAGGRIAYLGLDDATHTLSVYWNSQAVEKGAAKNATELSFYALDQNGTMRLNKRLYPEDFADGAYLTGGSSIEIFQSKDADGVLHTSGLFVTSDGSLSQVDATSPDHSIKRLVQFDAMATSGADGSPRILKLDTAKRTVGVVRQGYTAQIRKPANGRGGKPGSVIRALSLFEPVEPPALAVARFNKPLNKVVGSKVFADDFRGEDGLTRLIDGQESQWMLATRSGKVIALSTADAMDTLALSVLTQLGSRTGRIDYSASRDSIVAINSYGLDGAQEQIAESGELIVARRTSGGAQTFSIASASTASASVAAGDRGSQSPTPSIRRPCNINKK
ncbi:MAG TPA: hypothetical protein VJZ91_16735 [Blastocatellia bacterium]|nr:hypothetical protein [Blastocatellia bacterium]